LHPQGFDTDSHHRLLIMGTCQIICCLRDVESFRGVFPSDLLPHNIDAARTGTIIINAVPHTEKGSHWLDGHIQKSSYSSYYFDSYGLTSFLPSIYAFLKRNCSVWDHNTIELQGLITTVCGQYCCLIALYMDRGYTPKQFVALIDTATADRQICTMFEQEFGKPRKSSTRAGQCYCSIY
jgi:hypothetical protein